MDKPTKPSTDLPSSFGGVKENFSASKILNGYEKDVPDIFGGANINYMLDTWGKRQTYYDTIVDFINGLPIGKTITTDNNNKLVYDDLRVDLSGLANVDLNNLTATGENHFANKDLSNLTTTGENHFANKDLSNLTATGEKHFINKTQVTNCILEAPSAIALTAFNATLTLAGNVKLIVPNGRFADGRLNNIEVVTPIGGLSYTYSFNVALQDEYIIYSVADGLRRFNKEYVYFLDNGNEIATQTGSNNMRYAYVLQQNTWWEYKNNEWTQYPMTIIGRCDVAANNVISNLRQNYPISIFTDSSTSKHYIARCAMPSSMGYETLVWGLTGTDYTAPKDGYFTVWKDASSDMDFICLSQVVADGTIGISTVASTSRYDESVGLNYMHIFLPAKKGQKVNLTYRGTGRVNIFRFVYAEGVSV